MTDDDAKKKEEEAALAAALHAAAAQPQVKEMLQCLYKDPRSGKPCPFESRSEVVLQMHERAEHIKKDGIMTNQDEESQPDTKNSKRMETKITRFSESETPSEYRRKTIKFESYRLRCGIEDEEVSDNLYMA